MNRVIIIGRLTADPELKTTSSGVSVCGFSIAVDRRTKTEKKTDFIDCTAWRSAAEFICKYFQKGKPICLTGSLTTENWVDQNRTNRKKTFVTVENVEFIPSDKSDKPPETQEAEAPAAISSGSDEDFQQISDDDLPF